MWARVVAKRRQGFQDGMKSILGGIHWGHATAPSIVHLAGGGMGLAGAFLIPEIWSRPEA